MQYDIFLVSNQKSHFKAPSTAKLEQNQSTQDDFSLPHSAKISRELTKQYVNLKAQLAKFIRTQVTILLARRLPARGRPEYFPTPFRRKLLDGSQ